MSDRKGGRSRRDVLASMGGLSVAGTVGSSIVAPVFGTSVPFDEAATLRAAIGAEATAVGALEGVTDKLDQIGGSASTEALGAV